MIAAGDAQTYCYYFSTPNNTALGVKRFLSHMGAGMHHAILFTTPTAAAADGTLTQNPCGTFPNAQISAWLYRTQEQDEDLVFPASDGAGNPLALEVAAAQPAFLQIYMLNATAQPLTASISIKAEALDPLISYTKSAAYLTTSSQIFVQPAGGSASDQHTCAVPAATKFWWLSTRTHKFATQSKISDGLSDLVVATDWEHPTIARYSPPSFYQFAAGLTYHCDYFDPENFVVTSGDSENSNEACIGVGYFFPATGPKVCLNNTGPL
jgi:hypothetical protein